MNTYQKLLGLRILYDSFKNEEAEFALINMLKVYFLPFRQKLESTPHPKSVT